MTMRRSFWSSALFTLLWIGVGVVVFFYFPMSSVFHQPTGRRVVLASAFFAWLLANIVLAWVEPVNRFTSNVLNRGLGALGVILLLWYS